MSGPFTLAQIDAQIQAWYDASLAVSTGQSYSYGGRTLTRANVREIRDNLKYWTQQREALLSVGQGGRGDNVMIGVSPHHG